MVCWVVFESGVWKWCERWCLKVVFGSCVRCGVWKWCERWCKKWCLEVV